MKIALLLLLLGQSYTLQERNSEIVQPTEENEESGIARPTYDQPIIPLGGTTSFEVLERDEDSYTIISRDPADMPAPLQHCFIVSRNPYRVNCF